MTPLIICDSQQADIAPQPVDFADDECTSVAKFVKKQSTCLLELDEPEEQPVIIVFDGDDCEPT